MGRPALRRPQGVKPIAAPSRLHLFAHANLVLIRAIRSGCCEPRSGLSQEPGPALVGRGYALRRVSGRGGTARHAREWRVLAGFWREKASAGRVPSLISACAAADARRGIFAHYPCGVRACAGRPPSIPTRLRRPFPSFLHHRRGRAAHPAPRSAQPCGVTSITFFDRPRDLGPPSH